MRELLFLLLVLACPPAMLLMMRGGHGHGGHSHGGHASTGVGHGPDYEDRDDARVSTEALRARRDELDQLIADREKQRERQETGATC